MYSVLKMDFSYRLFLKHLLRFSKQNALVIVCRIWILLGIYVSIDQDCSNIKDDAWFPEWCLTSLRRCPCYYYCHYIRRLFVATVVDSDWRTEVPPPGTKTNPLHSNSNVAGFWDRISLASCTSLLSGRPCKLLSKNEVFRLLCAY